MVHRYLYIPAAFTTPRVVALALFAARFGAALRALPLPQAYSFPLQIRTFACQGNQHSILLFGQDVRILNFLIILGQ